MGSTRDVNGLFRSRSQRAAAIVASVLLLVIGFRPLFGGPGYEHALASGLILPAAAAIATALDVARADRSASPLALYGRGIASGLVLASLGFATALLHGLRVGFCDLAGGARGYLLTAAIGAVLGGAWGVVAGVLAARARRKRLACTLLGLAAPVGGIALSLWRFYTSPIVFAFDPFFGYFSGTLYDTVIDAGTPLLTYRLGSLSTLGAGALIASVVVRRESGAFALSPLAPSAAAGALARLALGAVFACVSLGITIEGAPLGHWQTSSTIQTALGGHRAGPRCDVVYPAGEREDQIALLVRDCEEELAHDEAFFGGPRFEGRITAFFFRDAQEKKRLMGAADTYIAKPWRREVYLQLHAYPHPVLGHEIAHVVAGSFGQGPFRIAGAHGGLWPNPGLIEGVAVAASPDEEELTEAQWAGAMMGLGILPPGTMPRIFSLRFLGESSAKSYTLAGAFVRWIIGRWGSDVIRRWYGGEDVTALTGLDWSALDDGFRTWIAELKLAPEVAAYAKARFDRPSVFGRTCPHVVDGLRGEADRCRDALQVDRARHLYDEVLARDPHDWAARYGLGTMELKFGDSAVGGADLRGMADDEAAPRPWRDRSAEVLADALLASDVPAKWAQAGDAYAALARRSLDEDYGRTLEVKAYAAARGEAVPEARVGIVALLIGSGGRPVDGEEGLARVAAWARGTDDPVAEYVLGKNLANREFWAEAATHLDRAIAVGEPTPRIGRELLKVRAVCACALGDTSTAREIGARVEAKDGVFGESGGRRAWVLALLERCGQGGGNAPRASSPVTP
jgi:hypothetical protein